MPRLTRPSFLLMLVLTIAPAAAQQDWRSMAEVLQQATADDWRDIEPANLLFMELDRGVVVIELAPQFAPRHAANLRTLLAAGHFKEASVKRSQDNYVAQWSGSGPFGDAAENLPGEFFRASQGLDFVPLESRDAYAARVGFVDGFPVGQAKDGKTSWLAHCYGMVGAGRGNDPESGNGAELYAVTGHSPRHLDRNVTLLGRVISGIDSLSSLPRGGGRLGFYESGEEHVPIRSMRIGTDYDAGWQALRTDTPTFQALIESRRYRNEDWFIDPAGAIGLCNVPLPVRRID